MRKTLDDANIVSEYEAGDSLERIARRRNVATDTVSCRLRAAGVKLRVRQRSFSREEVLRIRALANSGWSTRRLAGLYGVTQSSMWKIVSGKSYGFISSGAET